MIDSKGLRKYDCIVIDNIKVNKEEAKIVVDASTTAFVSQKDLDYLKKLISDKYGGCQVIMKMKYGFDVAESKKLFIEDYFEWLISGIKGRKPFMYTALSNAKMKIEDGNVIFTLTEIERDALERENFINTVQKDLMNKFDLDIRVKYNVIAEDAAKLDAEFKAAERQEFAARQSENAPVEEVKPQVQERKFGGPQKMVVEKIDESISEEERDKSIIIGVKIPNEDLIPLDEVYEKVGSQVASSGEVFFAEENETKTGKKIFKFYLTNYKDSITVKFFATKEKFDRDVKPAFFNDKGKLKKGLPLKVSGFYDFDDFEKDRVLIAKNIELGEAIPKRMDTFEGEKRVELHMHTEMSDMDALCPADEIIATASRWGHRAIAITDHGNVQSFPIAEHNKGDMKILYGVEAYLVDDIDERNYPNKLKIIEDAQNGIFESEEVKNALKGKVVVFDIETTGFDEKVEKIIEIGAVKVEDGKIIDRFSTFINPEKLISKEISDLTHITQDMVDDADTIDVVLPKFLEWVDGVPVVAHNAKFDTGFISYNARKLNLPFGSEIIDTLAMSQEIHPKWVNHKLDTLCDKYEVDLSGHHRAVNDAEATVTCYLCLLLDRLVKVDVQKSFKDSYHCIIFAKNTKAIRHLYKLVSDAHVKYIRRFPLTPKSEVMKIREHLIIGSACEAGELYTAILRGKSDEELKDLIDFYDYLEIQPLQNNMFMLDKTPRYDRKGNVKEDEYKMVQSEEDLRNINRRICKLGEMYNKPVVATSDAHFIEPSEDVVRKILLTGKGFEDGDRDSGLYLKTTDEMLKEMSYLGEDKAYEVTVTNTNKVCDMIEDTCPLSPDKATPYIENCEEDFKNICDETAHAMYGPNPPEIVEERLKIERDAIIENGYTVLYMIAQKLVKKSNDDGYLVGSRGSVGSSFAATMAGITEVNPLPAHYCCPNCHYVDFDSDLVKSFSGMSGCDMPDMDCPKCGTRLDRWGHDIPFQTFLGFNADKEPDIDLNFSGDYQPVVHAYTESLFGKGHAYRAGTIGTLADKTAYGYAKHYFEDKHQRVSNAELQRLIDRAVGTRRTTGQHPGGIVVLPADRDIYDFCPIQWPANDTTAALETTHFDYHSIDSNLLKLDILGHDDPTMIRFLEDMTGINAKTIELGDPGVMGLFKGLDTLKRKSDFMNDATPTLTMDRSFIENFKDYEHVGVGELDDCKLGILGVPEFGTPFAMQMVIDTAPESFSDLVRISGLSHGTDVWLNNAQTLIKEGKAKLSQCICCRDDIMIFLINKGLEKGLSFKIMESVRKGKGLTPEMEEAMIANGKLPDWYIDSCKKIKYMFPKAHAVAYVMMAWRIAWFKVYRPIAYYCAFLGIRAKAFDYEKMCNGSDRLKREMDILKQQAADKTISNKDEDLLAAMKIVQEMYARGFEFEKVNLYESEAKLFHEKNGKIQPSFTSIPGLGENVAVAIETEAKKKPFATIDEFVERTGANKTVVQILKDNGILDGIPESNQMSLFDDFNM